MKKIWRLFKNIGQAIAVLAWLIFVALPEIMEWKKPSGRFTGWGS